MHQLQPQNNNISKSCVIVLVSMCLLLAACGGGGGSSSMQTDTTGIEPNSILISDMLISIGGVEDRISNVVCRSDLSLCQATYRGQTFSFVPTSNGDDPDVFEEHSTLGEWNHMVSGIGFIQNQGLQGRLSISYGVTQPGSIPSGTATWTGDMVAYDSNNRVVRGDASIKLTDLGDPRVDVRLTPQSHAEMEWKGLNVRNGGFTERQSTSDYIKGEFYGPNAEESGGVFEKNGLIGAFGANR